MNKVILFGKLGQDPEVKNMESGKTVAKFSLATNETYTVNGEKKTETQWHNIVMWGKTAETAGKYLKKGASVIIEGKIVYRSYENKEKKTVYITEIVCDQFHFTGAKTSESIPDKQGQYQKSGDVEADIRAGKYGEVNTDESPF